jgi:hypothetical protein
MDNTALLADVVDLYFHFRLKGKAAKDSALKVYYYRMAIKAFKEYEKYLPHQITSYGNF